MTKLSDTQRVILGTAAGRKDHTVFPLPKSLKAKGAALTKALEAMRKSCMIEERTAKPGAVAWRKDDAGGRYTLIITDTGLAALEGGASAPAGPAKANAKGNAAKRKIARHKGEHANTDARNGGEVAPAGKLGAILGLLRRPKGASITHMQRATGWQPHSVRAALMGLRKRGIGITRCKEEGSTIYRAED